MSWSCLAVPVGVCLGRFFKLKLVYLSMAKYFLLVRGPNLKYLICMNDLLRLKRLGSNLDVMQDEQAGSRWGWLLLCNCRELTCKGYVTFLGLQET